MKAVAYIACAVALAGTLMPAVLYLGGTMPLDRAKLVMLAATVVWFVAAPIVDRQTRLEKIVEDSGREVVP